MPATQMSTYAFLIILSALFLFAGVWLIRKGMSERRRGLESARWPAVQGRMIASYLEAPEPDSPWSPEVHYRYSVGGREFDGNRIEIGFEGLSHAAAKEFVEQFPAGAEIAVRYDPSAPEISALRVAKSPGEILIVLGGFTVLIAPVLIIFGW